MKFLFKYFLAGCLHAGLLGVFVYSASAKAGDGPEYFTIQNNPDESSPFFTNEVLIYPESVQVSDDGSLLDATGDRMEDAEKIRQTAECTSRHVLPHTITRAYAWKEEGGILNAYLVYESGEVNDHLLFTIVGDKVMAKYWTWPTLSGGEISWEIRSLSFRTNKSASGVGERFDAVFDLQLSATVNHAHGFTNRIRGYIKPEILDVAPEEFRP